MGVSSVAKIGEAEEAFGIASAWGWRLGYEYAHDLATEHGALSPFDVVFPSKEGPKTVRVRDRDSLREALSGRKMTPWGVRNAAQDRGNWAHDLLEALAQDSNSMPALVAAMEKVDDEYQGHARAILQWYLDFRPSFVATEVQVTSTRYGFAGRYDIRCKIAASVLLARLRNIPTHLRAVLTAAAKLLMWSLCLVDLKTSKRIYPLSHFVQLEGYELAGVEMGFPPTDVRLVLNTHPDGTYDFEASYATGDHFLSYLDALRSMRELKALDPEEVLKAAREVAILEALSMPARFGRENGALARELAGAVSELDGLDGPAVGRILGGLRKRGAVEQCPDKTWTLLELGQPAQVAN